MCVKSICMPSHSLSLSRSVRTSASGGSDRRLWRALSLIALQVFALVARLPVSIITINADLEAATPCSSCNETCSRLTRYPTPLTPSYSFPSFTPRASPLPLAKLRRGNNPLGQIITPHIRLHLNASNLPHTSPLTLSYFTPTPSPCFLYCSRRLPLPLPLIAPCEMSSSRAAAAQHFQVI